MKPLNYEAILEHPGLRQEIVRAAHRQRAEEVGRLLARLYSALKPRKARQHLRHGHSLAIGGR